MSEFTGKTRIVYEVRVTLSERCEAEHVSEGWVPMPADKPSEMAADSVKTVSAEDAGRVFRILRERLRIDL